MMTYPGLTRFMLPFIVVFLFSGAAAAGQAEWESALKAARAEGKVVVIGPPVAAHREAIVKFQETFPDIRLEYTGTSPAQRDTRIGRERQLGQYLWDVMVGGISTTAFTSHIPEGWFDPLKTALVLPEVLDDKKWLGGFDAGFQDKAKKHAYAFSLYALSNTFVNRDLAPQSVLAKPEDLLDPRLKGKIAWNDPRVRGSGAAVFAHLWHILGDGPMKRVMSDQDIAITSDTRQLAEWVVRGRYAVGLGVNASDVARFQKEGIGTSVARLSLPVEAVTVGFGGAFLLNRAPHPHAARVFLNWFLGQHAQAAWAQLGSVNSRRLDVPLGDPETAVDPRQLDRYLKMSHEETTQLRADAITFAKSLLP